MQNRNDIAAGERLKRDWPDRFKISIWLVKENEHWSALVSEFNVVGMGLTQDAALENLRQNLNAYLASYAAEGASFDEVKRRISYRESLRLWFFALATRFARSVTSSSRTRRDGVRPRSVQHSHEDFGPTLQHC